MEFIIRRAEPRDYEGVCRTFEDGSLYAGLRAGRYVDVHAMARLRPRPVPV